jgi:hypothetical protein
MVDSLCDLCREVGIPEALVMDGNGAQNNPEVDSVVCKFVICVHKSELENQQQNRAKCGGGILKQGLRRLHFETRFDIAYWCYAVIYYCDCCNHTALRDL